MRLTGPGESLLDSCESQRLTTSECSVIFFVWNIWYIRDEQINIVRVCFVYAMRAMNCSNWECVKIGFLWSCDDVEKNQDLFWKSCSFIDDSTFSLNTQKFSVFGFFFWGGLFIFYFFFTSRLVQVLYSVWKLMWPPELIKRGKW